MTLHMSMCETLRTQLSQSWQTCFFFLAFLFQTSHCGQLVILTEILTCIDGFSEHTTFSVPSPSVFRAFSLYAVCQQFIVEFLSVFTMLEVVFCWHLGGVEQGGVRRGRINLQVKWLLFACMCICLNTESKILSTLMLYVRMCVCVCARVHVSVHLKAAWNKEEKKVGGLWNTFEWWKIIKWGKHWLMHIHTWLPDLSAGINDHEDILTASFTAHTVNAK